MYPKLHHCWATVEACFSLNESMYQSKKTDKEESPEMKNFHVINFDYIAIIGYIYIYIYFFFRSLKSLLF